MENIIEELIHIEEKADLVMAQTMKDRENLKTKIRSESEEIKSRTEKEAAEIINRLYEEAKQESQEKVRQMQEESQIWVTDMQGLYDEKHGQWEDEILNRIIRR